MIFYPYIGLWDYTTRRYKMIDRLYGAGTITAIHHGEQFVDANLGGRYAAAGIGAAKDVKVGDKVTIHHILEDNGTMYYKFIKVGIRS